MAPLTDAQLRAEIARCQSCEAKPCRGGCPAGLSPADFILAARCGEPSDYRRAAAQILGPNPLGGVCGEVCPDSLCMARCSRRALDGPVNIPAIQGAIVREARRLGVLPRLDARPATGQRVAVVGAGPAGLGAASVLAKAGHAVHLFDRSRRAGGMLRLIPRARLDPEVLEADLASLLAQGEVKRVLGKAVALPRDLLARGFAAVVVAGGLGEPTGLEVPGRERAFDWTHLLGPRPPSLRGKRVAIVGDGAVAADCALQALALEASHVELFALRKPSELPLPRSERERLFASGVHVTFRVRVVEILGMGKGVTGLALRRLELPAGQAFHPSRLVDLKRGGHERRRDFDAVVLAIGGQAGLRREPHPRIVYAGDLATGPTTVVEALASGKRAGLEVHKLLSGSDAACPDRPSCPEGGGACPKRATCPEWSRPEGAGGVLLPLRSPGPVALDADFLGRRLTSPFLLAAESFTAGHYQVRRAYEAGWPGAVLPDGASPADLDRLRREFPDRLTLTASELPPPGDPEDYRSAARLLAGGARVVAVDALARRHGLGILGELEDGLSHLLAEHGLGSVAALSGWRPARGASPAAPAKATVDGARCVGCGNCTRCPPGAVALDARGLAAVDAARCDGCALCVDWCFAGAIGMRPA